MKNLLKEILKALQKPIPAIVKPKTDPLAALESMAQTQQRIIGLIERGQMVVNFNNCNFQDKTIVTSPEKLNCYMLGNHPSSI